MMTYTRSAIGQLTRQYRSVLRKCFLINMGLFALGAVSAMSAHAAIQTPTLSVGYEGKFREHYQDHTGIINAKYEF